MNSYLTFILGLLAVTAAAEPARNEVQEAIDYVNSKVLKEVSSYESLSFENRYKKVIDAMKSHPVYSKWLVEDTMQFAKWHSKPYKQVPFNCNLKKSSSVPTSVHRLQPGDIKVISAMGDSLTTANGALATNIPESFIQYRGFSWSVGGETDLEDVSTLPNILRKGNSKLYGYSIATGRVNSETTRLNLAEPGKKAPDMLYQAKRVVERMKASPEVDFENDWKLVTIFIGGNDLCAYCKNKRQYSPSNYIKNIKAALDYLHENLPRAFVNMNEILNVAIAAKLKDGTRTCSILHSTVLCTCASNPANEAEAKELKETIASYQRLVSELVDTGRYDTREDFTVVSQPFYRRTQAPLINGEPDFSYFGPDCFHFSKRGHGEAGKALWNNMLQPVGRKSDIWDLNGPFRCPTFLRPYLMTRQNS